MRKDSLRGHNIFLKNNTWFYEDTKEPTVGNPRDCGNCGRPYTKEGHDGCLGKLSNTMNACCGHGIVEDAYIQDDDGQCIRGEEALAKINQLRRIKHE